MMIFVVRGPYKVPFQKRAGGRTIKNEDKKEFWAKHRKRMKRRGCYVFGMRTGKGVTPWYVGKATKGLGQEVFAADKLHKYQQALAEYKKGGPVLFFVLAPVQKGKPNNKRITQVENHLISLGVQRNESLLNVKGTKQPKWGIIGVIRGGKGKVARGTPEFRLMMGVR